MVQQLDGTVKREESCYKIIFSVNAEASPEAEKIIALTADPTPEIQSLYP